MPMTANCCAGTGNNRKKMKISAVAARCCVMIGRGTRESQTHTHISNKITAAAAAMQSAVNILYCNHQRKFKFANHFLFNLFFRAGWAGDRRREERPN
jgi:hypothetical protein